jgi:hypothetical protein
MLAPFASRRVAVAALALVACNAAETRTPVATLAIPSAAPSAAPSSSSSSAAPNATTSDDPLLDAVGAPKLTPREREEWGTYMTEMLAPCADMAVSVAQCVTEKRACAACAPAAQYLLRAVRDGRTRERIERDYKRRFDPSAVKAIPIDGSPMLGATDAPVTVVVFSDFECPACAVMSPLLIARATEGPSVRLVYKFVSLAHHVHAELAARAAIAAGVQGKFWPMHHEIFTHQDALEQRDLERYAKGLKLDMKRFLADMKSPTTTARLAADSTLWHALGVTHTPTIFVGGREIDDTAEVDEWIADAKSAPR